MAVKGTYARGSRAWGICQRSGTRYLLRELVEDGRYPGLLVHPDWWEGKHPQETPVDVSDPIALRRPSPDNSIIPVQHPDPPTLNDLLGDSP